MGFFLSMALHSALPRIFSEADFSGAALSASLHLQFAPSTPPAPAPRQAPRLSARVDTPRSAMLLTYDLNAGLWVLAPGSRFAPAKPQLTRCAMP